MTELVIKTWKAETKPIDTENNYVNIVGRRGGLISWLLSILGINPTTKILVGSARIEFTTASLAGTQSRMIPLEGICSTYYGYHKPWKVAASIIGIFVFIGYNCAQTGLLTAAFVITIVGAVIALAYYFLNRTLTLGFVENSGLVNGILFKRSVIENVDINHEQAKAVCVIVQRLIEAKGRHRDAATGELLAA
jgi:hypothetical protein